MEDLKAFVKDSGSAEANDLANWDLNFWSERLRESKYDIDEVVSSLYGSIFQSFMLQVDRFFFSLLAELF
jgi:Zn-dependent oligopeptidase